MIGAHRYPGARWGVALALWVSLAWMPAPYASSDEGHGHAKKKQSTPSKTTAPKKAEPHGHAEGTQPHEDAGEVKPRGMPGMGARDMPGMGMRGMPGHGQGKPPGDAGSEKTLSPLATRGKQLVKDLHCNACHVRIEEEGHVHAHVMPAPDITFLGDKLRADWLYAFLKNPHTLRPWLKVRMPDFRLTDREALALTKHIVRDMRDRRLNPDWMTRFLRDPQSIYPGTKMPNFFFEDGDPLMEGAEEMMLSIRDYLMSRVSGRSRGYYKALRRYPNVTAAEGYRLMDEINCAGCHNVRGFHRTLKVGPILRYEGSKVSERWLKDFLRKPHTIRPDGYLLGSKARMPNFRLAEPEVQAVSAYLMALKDEGARLIKPTADRPGEGPVRPDGLLFVPRIERPQAGGNHPGFSRSQPERSRDPPPGRTPGQVTLRPQDGGRPPHRPQLPPDRQAASGPGLLPDDAAVTPPVARRLPRFGRQGGSSPAEGEKRHTPSRNRDIDGGLRPITL